MSWCRDAEDAVRGRDGYDFGGNSIRVELSRGGAGAGRPRRWSVTTGSLPLHLEWCLNYRLYPVPKLLYIILQVVLLLQRGQLCNSCCAGRMTTHQGAAAGFHMVGAPRHLRPPTSAPRAPPTGSW